MGAQVRVAPASVGASCCAVGGALCGALHALVSSCVSARCSHGCTVPLGALSPLLGALEHAVREQRSLARQLQRHLDENSAAERSGTSRARARGGSGVESGAGAGAGVGVGATRHARKSGRMRSVGGPKDSSGRGSRAEGTRGGGSDGGEQSDAGLDADDGSARGHAAAVVDGHDAGAARERGGARGGSARGRGLAVARWCRRLDELDVLIGEMGRTHHVPPCKPGLTTQLAWAGAAGLCARAELASIRRRTESANAFGQRNAHARTHEDDDEEDEAVDAHRRAARAPVDDAADVAVDEDDDAGADERGAEERSDGYYSSASDDAEPAADAVACADGRAAAGRAASDGAAEGGERSWLARFAATADDGGWSSDAHGPTLVVNFERRGQKRRAAGD
jgi:hypothetical protein